MLRHAGLVVWLGVCGLAALAAPVGWRMDGSGRYPAATAVSAWAPDRQVVWSTPLPAWGNASPILINDRLFITAEPTTLLCLDAVTGAIRWQRTNTYDDFLTPAEQAQLKDELAQAARINQQIRGLRREQREKQDQLAKTPDDEALKAAVAAVKTQLDDQQKQLNALPLAKQWQMPVTHPTNGFSSPTPTSDGVRVWTQFGNGIAVCYDVDGTLRWRRFLEKPTNAWGHSCSPLLVDDILVVQYNGNVYGLKAQTGETAWQAKSPFVWGSPARARIGGADVVITPGGILLNPRDGKLLGKIPAKPLEYNVPLVQGDVVYWVQGESLAVKLVPKDDGTIDPQVLWKSRIKAERYYASPLLHDGLIYAVMRYGTMTVLDANDGTPVYEQRLNLGGEYYASFVLAGNVILLSGEQGVTAVLEPGRIYKEIERNRLEPFRTTAICDGKRMYIRGRGKMWCLGG